MNTKAVNLVNDFSKYCDYLPDSRGTFEKVLGELGIFKGNSYTLYEDRGHTMTNGETWEYRDYKFYFDDNKISFEKGWIRDYSSNPETNEYVVDELIIAFISKYLENDTIYNNKRIGYANGEFYVYEVDVELHEEYNKIKKLLYKSNFADIIFNPHTLTFEKYIWLGSDYTEDFNKSLNELEETLNKTKHKKKLKAMLKNLSIYKQNIDFIKMKKGKYKFHTNNFSYIEKNNIYSKTEYLYKDKVFFFEEKTIDRPPFTAEDILNGYVMYDDQPLYFNYLNIGEKDIEGLKEAVSKHGYIAPKDIAHLLGDDIKKNNKNIGENMFKTSLN